MSGNHERVELSDLLGKLPEYNGKPIETEGIVYGEDEPKLGCRGSKEDQRLDLLFNDPTFVEEGYATIKGVLKMKNPSGDAFQFVPKEHTTESGAEVYTDDVQAAENLPPNYQIHVDSIEPFKPKVVEQSSD
mgnify:CR=1 FL=1|tara:strand:- start:5122 stop:5517 length:396 start_codon:yes stop_codon:yes gene_type:complete